MCRLCMLVFLSLVSFSAFAEDVAPVEVRIGGVPLVTSLEQRLARTDEYMQGIVQRPVQPTDKQFVGVMSNSLASNISPLFPENVPGVELLLKHGDLRIRYVGLKLLTDGVQSQRTETTKLAPEIATRLRRRCLSVLEDAAQGKSSPALNELAGNLYLILSDKQPTEDENQSLQELLSANQVLARKAALQIFLVVQSSEPDERICQSIETFFQNESAADQVWLAMRLRERKEVTGRLRETICRTLRRNPQMQGAKHLSLLLAKTRPVPTEAIPGLIEVIAQGVPRVSGGMCCSPQSSVNRQLVLDEQGLASRALNEISHTDITVVPCFLKLLDHPEIEVRRQGVNHLSQFGSLALGALPKVLTMNKGDDRPEPRWQLGPDFGILFEVIYAVKRIVLSSLIELNGPQKYKVLLGAAYVGLREMK